MLFGFSLVLALVIMLGGYNYFAINNTNDRTEEIVNEQLPVLIAGENISYNTAQRLALARGYILYGISSFKDEFNEHTQLSKELQGEIFKYNNSDEVVDLFNQMDEWTELILNEVFTPYDQGDEELAKLNLTSQVVHISDDILDTLEKLTSGREQTVIETGNGIVQSGKTTLMIGLAVTVVVIIISFVAALLTSNSIANPINVLMERMRLIADGDLSQEPLEINLADEVGQLMIATNDMNHDMKSLLAQINQVSETVSSHSEELTQAANEVSGGTEQVSSTMQELASGSETQANHASELSHGMGLFTSKIDEANADGRDVQQSSHDIIEMTSDGYELMEKSTTQMNTINDIVSHAVKDVRSLENQSRKISELVNVIEDIAEQTNLLALNAAIEAARAGEQGQGFAVVAEEVRNLAEGVSDSVTDITGIVTSIQQETEKVTESLEVGYEEVEQGTTQMVETGETFNRISSSVNDMVDNIQSVTDHLSDIASESEQMNSAVQEIAAVSEEAAAGVEETTATAEQASSAMEEVTASSNVLAQLAEDLNGLVQQFKV